MKLSDYFRLASAGLWRQKRQTLKTTLIMGTISTFLLVCGFLLWGAIDLGIEKINQPSYPKILAIIDPDPQQCASLVNPEQDDATSAQQYPAECKPTFDLAFLRRQVQKYDGKLIEQAGTMTTGDGEIDILPAEVVKNAIEVSPENAPSGALPVLIPTRTALEWLGFLINPNQATFDEETGTMNLGPEATPETIEKAREQSLGKVLTSPTGENYFIVGFLPSSVQSQPLLHTDSNLLNFFIDRTMVGKSKNLIAVTSDTPAESSEKRAWAIFDNADAAYQFHENMESDKRYKITSPFGHEFDPKWSYGSTENLFTIVAVIFGVLAFIVSLITLIRLARRDGETMALYYTLGAKPRQLRLVQMLRMILLCLLTGAFTLLASTIICLAINLLSASTLAEAYALSFGTPAQGIILFAWRRPALLFLGLPLLASPVAMLFSWRTYRKKPRPQS